MAVADDVAQEDNEQTEQSENNEQFVLPHPIPQEDLEKQRESVSLIPKLVKSLMH